MKTAVINIKTDPKLKAQAQEVAANLGFSLSSVINAYLRQLIRTKTVTFSAVDEVPSDYLVQTLKESEEDRLAGRTSPTFDSAEDAVAWLNDPNRKYQNQIREKI
jgi:addiction module RelB/DinJ family antitoxin